MRIELLKPHTHTGIEHLPGTVLDLEEDQGHWLIDIGVAKAASDQKMISKPISNPTEAPFK